MPFECSQDVDSESFLSLCVKRAYQIEQAGGQDEQDRDDRGDGDADGDGLQRCRGWTVPAATAAARRCCS